jgi:hypothetical protein
VRILDSSTDTVTVELNNVETLAICNALNEVRHGLGAPDPTDMRARLGATTDEVAAIHHAMKDALNVMDRF